MENFLEERFKKLLSEGTSEAGFVWNTPKDKQAFLNEVWILIGSYVEEDIYEHFGKFSTEEEYLEHYNYIMSALEKNPYIVYQNDPYEYLDFMLVDQIEIFDEAILTLIHIEE